MSKAREENTSPDKKASDSDNKVAEDLKELKAQKPEGPTNLSKLLRDCTFLQQGLAPLEITGRVVTKLDYELHHLLHSDQYGEDNILTCDNIYQLANAIQDNTVFCGKLDLKHQPLTDIAAMHIGRILSSGTHLTELDISQKHHLESKLTFKAGEYIGQGILNNPSCGMQYMQFKGIHLGESGLQRIIEAANNCPSLRELNFGIVTDSGLKLMAEHLKPNNYLKEIKFYETDDHQKYWTHESMQAFADLLKSHTILKKVKAEFMECNKKSDLAVNFHDEINFYTDLKKSQHKKDKEMESRGSSCDTDNMFQDMKNHIEKDSTKKMPVRKFFNNTFGQLLNDAIFAMQKAKRKASGEQKLELQRHEGKIKFIANFLIENLPKGETNPPTGMDDSD